MSLPKHILEALPGSPIHLSVRTREGVENLVLYRRAGTPFTVYENGQPSGRRWSDAALFEGIARRRGFERSRPRARPVRGDVILDRTPKLRLFLRGRRTARSLVVTTRDLATRSTVRTASVPATKHFDCGAASPAVTAAAHAESPFATQAATAPVALFTPPRRVDVGVDADYEFFLQYGLNSVAEMAAIINAAEAFYTEQIGMSFRVVSPNVATTSASNPSASQDAAVLLNAYRLAVNISPRFAAADTFHLFSGKAHLGLVPAVPTVGAGTPIPTPAPTVGVVGLAYSAQPPSSPGPVCVDSAYTYGLSQKLASQTIQSIVTAHELGHNLGATHDPGAAKSVMSAVVLSTGNSFSEFSRQQIANQVKTFGTCVPAETKYLTLTAKVVGSSFEATFTPTSGLGSGCKTSLYASKTRSALLGHLKGGTKLNLTTIRKNKVKVLKGKLDTSGPRRALYLRAVTYCTAAGIKNYQGSSVVTVRTRDRNPITSLAGKLK